jgi:hypothetical protein
MPPETPISSTPLFFEGMPFITVSGRLKDAVDCLYTGPLAPAVASFLAQSLGHRPVVAVTSIGAIPTESLHLCSSRGCIIGHFTDGKSLCRQLMAWIEVDHEPLSVLICMDGINLTAIQSNLLKALLLRLQSHRSFRVSLHHSQRLDL